MVDVVRKRGNTENARFHYKHGVDIVNVYAIQFIQFAPYDVRRDYGRKGKVLQLT